MVKDLDREANKANDTEEQKPLNSIYTIAIATRSS